LALSPLVLLQLQAWLNHPVSTMTGLGYALAAAIVLCRMSREQGRGLALAAAAALLLSSAGAWLVVRDGDDEPARLVEAIETNTPLAAIAPFDRVARRLHAQLGPDDRVLFDDVELFPLAALLDREDRIPSSRMEFGLAQQQPTEHARFIVMPAEASAFRRRMSVDFPPEVLAAHYRLIETDGPLLVYERRPIQ
jgi:hypothetical protein